MRNLTIFHKSFTPQTTVSPHCRLPSLLNGLFIGFFLLISLRFFSFRSDQYCLFYFFYSPRLFSRDFSVYRRHRFSFLLRLCILCMQWLLLWSRDCFSSVFERKLTLYIVSYGIEQLRESQCCVVLRSSWTRFVSWSVTARQTKRTMTSFTDTSSTTTDRRWLSTTAEFSRRSTE